MDRSGKKPPATALKLREAALPLQEGALQSDGSVLIHVIRPGLGTGKGRHIYPREVLKRDAHVFTGAKMYMNHLSEAAQKALEGLPRDIRDLGGHIIESWWDDDVPADDRFDRGAVVALAKPTQFMSELIASVPEAIATSINTDATGVKQTTHKGRRAYLVEGIQPPKDIQGSVDWVTEAGCGGAIVQQLRESAYDTKEEADMARFDSMTDEEVRAYIEEERPELLEALRGESPEGGDGDGDGDGEGEGDEGKERKVKTSAEVVREALSTEEGQKVLLELATPLIESAVAAKVEAQVASAIDDERDDIAAQARADALRTTELRDLRDLAHKTVESTRLPDEFKKEIKKSFEISEAGVPSPALRAIFPDFDDEGAVTKSSREKLTEAVNESIETMKRLHAAAAPARVRSASRIVEAAKPETDGDGGEGEGEGGEDEGRALPLVEALFVKSGVKGSPTKIYG